MYIKYRIHFEWADDVWQEDWKSYVCSFVELQ